MYKYRLVYMTEDWTQSRDYDNIEDIKKDGFIITWNETWSKWTWLEWQEYPRISWFLWWMKDGDKIIRYETQDVYDMLSQ